MTKFLCLPIVVGILALSSSSFAAETIWIEAEHLSPIVGYCFPDMDQKSSGHWALSGPGICPEWTQGGESEWLSIACGPDDAAASASAEFEVPVDGDYRLWVRYRDWRDQTEIFKVKIEQGGKSQEFTFGEKPVVDENDELKLLWKWAFGWDSRDVKLAKGPAKLTLLSTVKQPGHRQIDAFCLTTDTSYRPYHREKPANVTWKTLDGFRDASEAATKPLAARARKFDIPDVWKLKTFRDNGFLYLWNVGDAWMNDLTTNNPKRVLVPYNTDPVLVKEFREAFGGRSDVPIFSDPRIVPTWHGAGPNIISNAAFTAWLDANPTRPWANMMNYAPEQPMTEAGKANWARYRDRYVGNISGENLGYFDQYVGKLEDRVRTAKSREEVFQILTERYMAANAQKQKAVFGDAVAEPYQLTIPCESVGMTVFSHACREWGARTVGYENTGVFPSLAMHLAFLRGSARQYDGLFATYRSCNFGDSSTIYSEMFLYPGPRYIYDNSYDAWAGNGMTWYKFDIWEQYFGGSAMFYHEQGFDEFWTPQGGATPKKPIQLSPKGRLVDQFLQITRKHPDRGTPFTPIAFLLDRAHGWEPNPNWPSYFGLDENWNPSVLKLDRHARMLKEWFKVAYHPYGPMEAAVNTGANQSYLAGVFGDIFDVLVTSPTKLDAVDSYPVVVLNGQVTLNDAWGRKLAAYIAQGGTLIVSAEQVSGPGVAALQLPKVGAMAEADAFQWKNGGQNVTSQRYRYQPVSGGEALATAANGDVIASVIERGKGKLVFLSIPLGLGIDGCATPLVARTLADAREGLLPLEVRGEVEWMLNRTGRGWIVTLLNPHGANKPQHGEVVTDYSQSRIVKIVSPSKWSRATEWFEEAPVPVQREKDGSVIELTVPAGAARIVEIQ